MTCAPFQTGGMNAYVLSPKRPAGVEPALPPWQGGRLPLHHGRKRGVPNCQRTIGHRAGLEPTSPRYRCGVLAAGQPVLISSVGSEGLEPSPGGLRIRCAAANTLIPFSASLRARNRRGGNRTLDLALIRDLLSPLSYAPVGPKGLEPLLAGLKVRCAAVAPRPRNAGRAYPFPSCLLHGHAPRFQW